MKPFLYLALTLAFFNSHAASAQALEQGTLKDGKRVGRWHYYDAPNTLGLSIDYDSSKVLYVRPDTMQYAVLMDSTWEARRLSQAPRLIGSRLAFVTALQKSLRYPVAALRNSQTGSVVVACTVYEDGHMGEPVVVQAAAPSLGAEVVQRINALPAMRFIPALYRGRIVRTQVTFVVTFCIETQGLAPQCDEEARSLKSTFQQVIVTALGVRRPAR